MTQDEAVQLAREVGDCHYTETNGLYVFELSGTELTAYANKVREQTLLEAAEWFSERRGYESLLKIETAEELRRMAGVE